MKVYEVLALPESASTNDILDAIDDHIRDVTTDDVLGSHGEIEEAVGIGSSGGTPPETPKQTRARSVRNIKLQADASDIQTAASLKIAAKNRKIK